MASNHSGGCTNVGISLTITTVCKNIVRSRFFFLRSRDISAAGWTTRPARPLLSMAFRKTRTLSLYVQGDLCNILDSLEGASGGGNGMSRNMGVSCFHQVTSEADRGNSALTRSSSRAKHLRLFTRRSIVRKKKRADKVFANRCNYYYLS